MLILSKIYTHRSKRISLQLTEYDRHGNVGMISKISWDEKSPVEHVNREGKGGGGFWQGW